jgi:cellobiose phosphorylase
MSIDVLPNGSVFAIEHRDEQNATLVNQVLASEIGGSIARVLVRIGGANAAVVEAAGPGGDIKLALSDDTVAWEGETGGVRHRVTLALELAESAWVWHVALSNAGTTAVPLDAVLVQDIGLGPRGFLANGEAYASQYIDHHVAGHPRYGPVLMARQNLAQDGRHPWIAHGCLDGACGFATDGMQLFGPGYRDAGGIALPFGHRLPSRRLQHELACAALQSPSTTLPPGGAVVWRFFALYQAGHADASSDSDLVQIDAMTWRGLDAAGRDWSMPVRSVLQDAPPAATATLDHNEVERRYPARHLEERAAGRLLSFFIADPPHNRHVVLRDKERIVARRHGAILRSGQGMLPDDSTLCVTAWMHGVFGAQLTLGNTSLHKLLSVSRDPYNIIRSSGLRILVEQDHAWRPLAVPSAFDMGLGDCRWTFCLDDREVIVHAAASGSDPAVQWRIDVRGAPCRFLVFGHVVLGERELDQEGVIEVDASRMRFAFRPDPGGLWGQRYPGCVHYLVTSTPQAVEAMGGDELLYTDGRFRAGPFFAIRTLPTTGLRFALVGSLTDADAAGRLADEYAGGIDDTAMLGTAARYWRHVTRGTRVVGAGPEAEATDAVLPWFAHDAMIHLTVPHGLEQYTGAAWGTRDVCQGPVEFLLALEHDEPVREILRILFAQQYAARGDWPQWFMLDPYAFIRDPHSHGDVIVWPLKALNDYLEATGDLGFLDVPIAWRDDATLDPTASADAVAVHIDKLLATVVARCIPGTHLIRYGHGDWNDSLQPVDPSMREWMVSSWTVALLFQQVTRYAAILRRAARREHASRWERLAGDMQRDFNRFLIRDGVVAGYALFQPDGSLPELLIHPCDTRTGLKYSLLPMTRSIIGGMFTPDQARHHLCLIREHLLFADGARLLDRPMAYRGGLERTFRRAESAAFFGREIGLMYVHAHIRYGEALAVLGEADALWESLQVVNPVAVTDRVAGALPRQRNAYFSSSDAAFDDRYEASAGWARVRAGVVGFDAGWRIYSSGPGIYTKLLICGALGRQREWGRRIERPLLPAALRSVTLRSDLYSD